MIEPAGSASHILVVEDHADTARVMSKLLQLAGYNTYAAATVTEAKFLCHARVFDLIVADISLPDGSAMDLLAESKGCATNGILVSAHDDENHKALAIKQGWSGYLVKPISFDVLLGAVGKLLSPKS